MLFGKTIIHYAFWKSIIIITFFILEEMEKLKKESRKEKDKDLKMRIKYQIMDLHDKWLKALVN